MAEPLQQAQAYAADGSPIAPGDVAAAVREGRGFFQKGAQVYARNPEGQLVSIDASEAHLPSYQILSPSELHEARLKQSAESVGGLVKTGAEGLARGATMGFLGPEQFYDSEGREAARARQRYNPNLSAGSELAGALGATVAASALTGGAAAETAGGELAQLAARGALTPFRAAAALGDAAEAGVNGLRLGEGVLGAGLRLGARGAAEGALMGAGHEVSQSALEDVPLTAERLLAGAWDGAKVGGALGGGMGLLGAGIGKAGRAIIGEMSGEGESLENAVAGWAERRGFKQVVGNNGRIFNRATNFGQDMARPQRIGRKILDAGVLEQGAPRAQLQAVESKLGESVAQMQGVSRAMDDAGVVADTGKILSTVDDQVSKLRETPIGDFQAIADRVEKQIAPFRERMQQAPGVASDTAPPMSFSELWEMRQKLDKTITWEKKAGGPAEEALRDMVSAFRSELDDSIARAADAGAVTPELQNAWKQATENYSDFALARDGLKDLIKRQDKNRFVSPSDYGTGGAAGMLVSLLSGNPIAGAATSAVTSMAHKLIRERGAGVMARMADRAATVASRIDGAARVAAMVEKPAAVARRSSINVAEQFQHYSDLIQQAKTDPPKFAAKMADATADLSLRAPEVVSEVQKQLLADLTYLDAQHPKPASRQGSSLTPLAAKNQVQFFAYDQQKAFVEAATALDNPLGVFDDIARGDLPLAGIKALKVRRPLLFNEMRQTVVKYTMTRKNELPFNRRMLLGVAFDFQSDWSIGHVSDIQQSLAMASAPQSKHDPTAAPSKIGTDPGKNIQPGLF